MFPRRPPFSRPIRASICLPGLLTLAILSGCAGQQATSEPKPGAGSAPESAAATDDDAARWRMSGEGGAQPEGGTASQGGDRAEAGPTGSGSMANRAESFASRVENRLNDRAAPSAPPANQPTAEAEIDGQGEGVQWASEQPESGSGRQQPGPPLRAAAGTSPATGAATGASPAPADGSEAAPSNRNAAAPTPQPSASPPLSPEADEAADTAAELHPDSLSNASLEQLTQTLRKRLREKADRDPQPLRSYLTLSALSLLDPEKALKESELAPLDANKRQSILAYQGAFSRLGRAFEKAGQADAEAGTRIPLRAAAETLTDELRKHQPLRIQNTDLCKRVDGYGVYTPFADHRFVAGREQPVIVYAELDNFTPQKGEDGRYLVRLNQRLVLYNESDGLAVWRPRNSETKIVDRSRNRRRDFFVVQVIHLPDRLTVGKYLLKLTITDEIGQTFDEASIPIRIVTESEVASGTAP